MDRHAALSVRHLVVAVPSATGLIGAGTVRSIVEGTQALQDAGWRVSFWPWERAAIIQHVRNEIAAAFVEFRDATHLLMIDDDMEFNPKKLVALVERPVDLVAGMYRGRGEAGPLLWRGPATIRRLEGNEARARALLEAAERQGGLIEADAVATGLLRLSRSCVERMTAASGRYAYNGEENAELFPVSVENGTLRTEDFAFCERWRKLGGRVWIDPEIETGHAYRSLAVCAFGDELRSAGVRHSQQRVPAD